MLTGPCLSCAYRHFKCHSTCKAYQEYSQAVRELNKQKAAQAQAEYDVTALRITGMLKSQLFRYPHRRKK